MSSHDNLCLLRRTNLAILLTLLFAGNGILELLKACGVIAKAQPSPLLPLLLVGGIVLGVYLFSIFICLAERVILSLLLAGAAFRLVLIWEPRQFERIDKYQLVCSVALSFSCAAISGFAAVRSLNRPGDPV
jgi:hypothetical protein